MRHLISILLENETGALSRVVGLFSQRGYNIETLTVAPTEDPHMSRITISTVADDIDLEQIKKQIHKLINVNTVSTLEDGKSEGTLELELIFLKVKANTNVARESMKRLADIFDAKIVDVSPESYTICLSAGRNKINRLLKAVSEQAEILETVRSGVVAISRGPKALGHK
ncbi:MAG TPA: acetolactate synthase small subunit [Candidatus Anaerobiospirillum pullistercoris]|uniref:Acetolactate synthase small subunit n=1 Tax=Candidatus Anaerobiospirillum pullistercoris TaxID=2838452 RepID=A0A9D1WC49_9GAMM|nr:acetolactate synthase small subunit [Candidatus Anaerobiospirillum pullistercoris]